MQPDSHQPHPSAALQRSPRPPSRRAQAPPAGAGHAGAACNSEVATLQRTIGNQAIIRAVRAGQEAGEPTLQRLMPLNTFKAHTALKNDTGFKGLFSKGRNKVDPVDAALAAFHQVDYANAPAKLAALDQVLTACTLYGLLPNKSARRKAGVQQLRTDAQAERPLVQQSVTVFGTPAGLAKVRQLVALQDQVVPLALARPGEFQAFNLHLADELATAVMALSAPDKQLFMQDDLNRLTAMSVNPGVPKVTRKALVEILANVPQADMGFGPAGAGFTNKAATDPKYFVMNNVKKQFGTGERLASLSHELTHVSVSESYDNTKMMWAFSSGLSDPQITALSAKRVNQLNQLIPLIDGVPALKDSQKSLLRTQLEYAKRPNLMADASSLSAPQLARYNALANNGVNWSALVEFDTNVNQCLVLLAAWGVPPSQPFHTLLQQVAREAYKERKAG